MTRLTTFEPEDASAVTIDFVTSEARVLRRGRHIIIARYLNHVHPVELVYPLSDDQSFDNAPASYGVIDREIHRLLATLRIRPAAPAEDTSFLRRVTLDLTGRLPTLAELKAFESDRSPDRRDRVIDRLLNSDAFTLYWTYRLAKLLRVSSHIDDRLAVRAYVTWLHDQVAKDVGFDHIAESVLTTLGDTHAVGPASFHRTMRGPRERAEFASELFMANRLRCANCHNHPLDHWTRDDYHGLAAVFAKVHSGRMVREDINGSVVHPGTGETARPRLPGHRFLESSEAPLVQFAEWLTTPNNPHFSKAIVNRLWRLVMGRGLVEPVDDMRATNPATHPELLGQLAEDFVQRGFRIRSLLRQIVVSDAYSRDWRAHPQTSLDDRYYSHTIRRPLEAEVLADAISDVLQVSQQYGEEPLGTRAVAFHDPSMPSAPLEVLGRCSNRDSCESTDTVSGQGSITRSLHLFNGELLNRRLADDSGRLARLLQTDATDVEIIDEFYRAALTRSPNQDELDYWMQQMDHQGESVKRRNQLEDFLWALMTCREFVFNH